MNKKEMLGIFQNPGNAYRGKPFWSWNGELDEKELIRQVGVMREMGFGGFFMHSRSGLITEYLGDEWFRLINAVADEGARQGMEVWLYDEDRWPSGSAGGKATEDVRYRMKSVYVYERAAAPYISGETELPECDYMFAARLGADGYTMSDYIQFKPGEATADVFARLTGEGEDKLLEMRIQPDEPSSNYNGNTYLDTMNVEAVDKFIELTHEQYLKRCGKRLGSVISGIFTDEPHRGQALDTTVTLPDGTRKCGIFYTNDIFDEFERRYGYDVQPLLPQIFYRLHGEPISRVRLDYFDLGCNLFNERFIERINDWCERHGIILTGHVLHENSLSNQAMPNGSLMRSYEHMDWPGIDFLGEDERCYWIARQCQSVCRQQGKKWMLSELYGCTGWRADMRMYKVIGDWQALLGVNVRCPHLSWYTMEGQSKRDYPASISYQSPYWRDFNAVESYFARFGLMMGEGDAICDTLVINPIESAWGLARIGWSKWIFAKSEDELALEKRYADVFNELMGARLDFDYADEQTLMRDARIERDGDEVFLRIGAARYRQVLMSGLLTVRASTIKVLKDFIVAGGYVALAGALPEYVGGERSDACRELIDAGAAVLPETGFAAVLSERDHCPITCGAGDQIFMQVRRAGDDYIVALLNNDRDYESGAFRVNVPDGYFAQDWDMLTGKRYALAVDKSADGKAYVNCALESAGTQLIVLTREDEQLEKRPAPVIAVKECNLPEAEYKFKLDEPNVCLMDMAAWSWNGGEEQPVQEVLRVDDAVRDLLGIERRGGEMLQPWFSKNAYSKPYGTLRLKYRFNCEVLPKGQVYLAGERPQEQQYSINGVTLTAPDITDWWADNAFIKMPVPEGAIRLGENVVEIETEFKRTTNIEALYLLGDFGVSMGADCVNTVTEMPATITMEGLQRGVLPFYTGRITYEVTPEIYGECVDKDARRVMISIPHATGALVDVSCGETTQRIMWEPYTADVTDAVRAGRTIEITMVNTRRNVFGPMHILPPECRTCSPGSFITKGEKWSDEYTFIEARLGDVKFISGD